MVIVMKISKGFTLIELLAVIAILAILVLAVTPMVTRFVLQAHNYSNETVLKNAEDAAVNYQMENSKNSTFIPNTCAVTQIIDKNNVSSLSSSCRKEVKVSTLINEGYLKDDASKLKKDGIVIMYKYKFTNDGKDYYDTKAYAAESLLN